MEMEAPFDGLLLWVVINPRKYKGGGGGWLPLPPEFFLSFFLYDKTPAPDVFSSCLFISRAHSKTNLVIVSCYGWEI